MRRFDVIPFLDLTNASRCSRAVSFYPCQMRARFDVLGPNDLNCSVCLFVFHRKRELSEVGHAWSLDLI